jgi:predicted Zn finger-like uncharacterized protein
VDIKFNCTSCGTHIVIDEAGAGMSVQCPRCNQALTVPTASPAGSVAAEPGHADTTTGQPGLHAGFGGIIESAIHAAAKDIESGIFDDDQKLDDYLRKEKPEVLAACYGKARARAFLEGKIDGKALMRSGFKLSPAEFARLKLQFNAIGKQPEKPQ